MSPLPSPKYYEELLGARIIPEQPRKIIGYVMAYGRTISFLTEMINEKLKEGFQPFNPVFTIISEENNKPYLIQAMVIYE